MALTWFMKFNCNKRCSYAGHYTKKCKLLLRISSVNVTKSAVSADFVTFTEEILNGWKASFFVKWHRRDTQLQYHSSVNHKISTWLIEIMEFFHWGEKLSFKLTPNLSIRKNLEFFLKTYWLFKWIVSFP